MIKKILSNLALPQFLNHPEMKKGNDRGRPACLCLDLLRVPRKSGLGEPFGKASLANTATGSSRSVSMTVRGLRAEEEWLPLTFKAWPDEALERGLPRPFAKRRGNWRRATLILSK